VEQPRDVGVVDRMNMSKADRLYVYAVARWIAALRGTISSAESQVIVDLAHALGVPDAARAPPMRSCTSSPRADRLEPGPRALRSRSISVRLRLATPASLGVPASKPG
jgi:hypothetical protein